MSEAPSRAASRRGRTLKLYLVDGSPSGVITAELGISLGARRCRLPHRPARSDPARGSFSHRYLSPRRTGPGFAGPAARLCRRRRPREDPLARARCG